MKPGEGVLYYIDGNATDELLLAVARSEHSTVGSLDQARTRCHAFTLDRLLDVAEPAWSTVEKHPQHMGAMTNRLWWVTYACFTTNECAGVLVSHPQGFHPKSVSLADIYEPAQEAKSALAFLAVSTAHSEPLLVPFPIIGEALLKPTKADGFRQSEDAFRTMLRAVVDRVNLIVPAVRLLDDVLERD